MEWLYPDEYIKTIFDIDYERLFREGYKGIMFDIDNTVAAFDQAYPTKEVIALFEQLRVLGFELALVSNNNATRVNKYNEKLKIHAFPRAIKPLTMNLKKAMNSMGSINEQTVFVGDQLFTDVWAGNALKFHTILVKPIQDKEQLITRVKRGVERQLIKRYLKNKT
jgi:hypothetical protein